jgi:hypothetical protein
VGVELLYFSFGDALLFFLAMMRVRSSSFVLVLYYLDHVNSDYKQLFTSSAPHAHRDEEALDVEPCTLDSPFAWRDSAAAFSVQIISSGTILLCNVFLQQQNRSAHAGGPTLCIPACRRLQNDQRLSHCFFVHAQAPQITAFLQSSY